MREVCLCAAVRTATGLIYPCRRHYHGIAAAIEDDQSVRQAQQGFLTNLNRFVDRKEGLRLQLAAGITSINQGGHDLIASPAGYRGDHLYSEDLY